MLRVIALVVLVGTTGLAAADPSSVGVIVTGDDSVSSNAITQVETWLGKHSFIITSKPLTKDAVTTVANCITITDLACARDVVQKRSAADSIVLIVAQASGPRRNRDIQLSAYWIAKKRDIVSLQRLCNHCTTDALRSTLDGLMTDLSHLVPAMTGKIVVNSSPPGLLVTVDNEAAGVTPLEKDVPAGKHVVALTRDGVVVDHKGFDVAAGETNTVTLVAPPVVKPKPVVIIRKSRAVPATLMVLGGAALATAGVFYAIGGPSGKNLYYTDLRTPSYFIAGGGAVLALVGVIWFARGGSTSTPTASITPGGALVGWAGRF